MRKGKKIEEGYKRIAKVRLQNCETEKKKRKKERKEY